jgi:hypothetical protein
LRFRGFPLGGVDYNKGWLLRMVMRQVSHVRNRMMERAIGLESLSDAGPVRNATGNIFRRRSTYVVALRLMFPELARPPWVRTHG